MALIREGWNDGTQAVCGCGFILLFRSFLFNIVRFLYFFFVNCLYGFFVIPWIY